MIKFIELTEEGNKIYLNVFNLDLKVNAFDIKNFYKNIKIHKVIHNKNKQGNFDLEINSKEEAVKLAQAGSGVDLSNVIRYLRLILAYK